MTLKNTSPAITILALETATAWLSLALYNQTTQLAFAQTILVQRAHSQKIIAEIATLQSQAKQSTGQEIIPNLIAIGSGPGSYTGLRVAASTALGLARAWNANVIGVPTLEVMACSHDGRVAVSLDARNENVYSAIFYCQDGQILETILKTEKRKREDFTSLARNADIWLQDVAPNALVLAKLALVKHQEFPNNKSFELNYL